MKVFAYIRVSGQSQVEGDGPDRQRAAILKFCGEQGLFLAGEFFDQGVSGTIDGFDRPQFAELLTYVHKRANTDDAVLGIVVERMDRLARDLMVSEMMLRECRGSNIKVFSTDQGALIDMACNGDADPTRTLIRQVLGAISQWEKSVIVNKLRAARRRTGRLGGVKPFGHKKGEAETLNFVQRLKDNGYTWNEIVRELNGLGLKPRFAQKWDRRGVRRIARLKGEKPPAGEEQKRKVEECVERILTT